MLSPLLLIYSRHQNFFSFLPLFHHPASAHNTQLEKSQQIRHLQPRHNHLNRASEMLYGPHSQHGHVGCSTSSTRIIHLTQGTQKQLHVHIVFIQFTAQPKKNAILLLNSCSHLLNIIFLIYHFLLHLPCSAILSYQIKNAWTNPAYVWIFV